ncbi:hypothetical protein LCGC14_2358440, partial [marine sediment metagenome]
RDYANGDYIPGAAGYVERWRIQAERFREAALARGGARLDLRYGSGARAVFDLFLPEAEPAGCVIFVHGGYWRAFDKSLWSHLAAGAGARGGAVAMPSYTLAPQARIGAITREIAQAVAAIASQVEGPLRLVGHSAGGHLVARMLCEDVTLAPLVAARIAGCVPISPLGTLEPLLETTMNADLQLDLAEARAESPALVRQARPVPVTVWVGAEERPVFLTQARELAGAWGCPLRIAPGQHHFDVIDGLSDPGAPLCGAVLGAQP